MNITAISVSRKSVWDQCTQLYRYKYHLKIPPPGEEPFYFTYGKLVHKISEEFVSRKGKTALGKVALLVLEGKIPIDEKNGKPVFAPSLPAAYKKRLPGHIDAIAKITKQLGTSGIVEYEFLYDLDPPNKKFVRGFIDRIIKKKDNYFILDYKTSKKGIYRKTRSNIRSDLELRAYARVIQRENDVPAKNIYAGLYYLEGAELVGARFTDKSLMKAEESLLYTYKQIENTPEDKAWGNVGRHCRRCDYVNRCPFHRLT